MRGRRLKREMPGQYSPPEYAIRLATGRMESFVYAYQIGQTSGWTKWRSPTPTLMGGE